MLLAFPLGAAEKPLAKSKSSAATNAPTKSIESLAEAALKSVVTISHHGRDGKPDGVGAGFVVASNGLIATCFHVIGEARPITVELPGGKNFPSSRSSPPTASSTSP